MNILLIDDNESDRDRFSRILNRHGHDVITLSSPVSAYLEVGVTLHPDLILVDLLLGTEDGLTAVKKLRTRTDAKIAVLTGLVTETVELAGVRAIDKNWSDERVIKEVLALK